MKNNIIKLAILFTFVGGGLSAQELSNYNLYTQNPFLYNPAYSIEKPEISAFLNTRLQWMGFEDAPTVNTFGVHGSVTETSGVGILVSNNSNGLINKFTTNFTYAYRARFSLDHYLQMGVGMGFVSDKLKDANEYTDATDHILLSQDFNQTSFSSSAGFAYFYKQFEAQLVFPQLYQRSELNMYTIAAIAYTYELNEDWGFKPSAIIKAPKTSPAQFDMNVMGMWRNIMWAQAGYRSNKSLLFALGVNIKEFEVGYSFQKNNSIQGRLSNGTNELQLIYRIKRSNSKVVSPRM